MPARPPPDLAPDRPADRPELIELDSGVYRPDTRVLTTQPREVELSPIEGRLLEYFAENAGRVLSHAALLRDVWGYAPGVRSRALYTTIGRLRAKIERDPSDPRHIVAIAASGYRFEPYRLPAAAPVDPFIGRAADLAALDAALATARLVSVLAPGGMGKTRLVRAWQVSSALPSTFCDLSAAIPSDVALRVAHAIGVPPGAADPAAQIVPMLRSRGPRVLVLDNAETVTAALAPLVEGWLGGAPDVRVLVTTREPLRARGERRIVLGPLSTEGGSDGVTLFLARMADVAPEPPTEEELTIIADIVRIIEGIPLAIELAARRTLVLSVASIRAQLTERLRLLAHPGETGRHRSMRSCIDGSWDALAPWEQAAFAQLSVFVANFGLESATEVLDLTPFPEAPWALDVLQSLLERNLLQAAVVEGARTFRLLDTLRDYAAERLAAVPGARERAEGRHIQRYAALGSVEGLDALRRAGGLERRALLVRERDELVAACRRAIARADGPAAAGAALAVCLVFQTAGPAVQGATLLEDVSRIPELPGAIRARVHLNLGLLLRSCGRPVEARVESERSLALAREAGATQVEGRALLAIGLRQRDDGDLEGAEQRLTQALVASRSAHDEVGESAALISLATVLRRVGRVREALAVHTRGLAQVEARGDPMALPATRIDAANLLCAAGDFDRGRRTFDDALAAANAAGDVRNAAFSVCGRGEVLLELGDIDAADVSFGQALAHFQQIGDTWAIADVWNGRAEVSRLRGRLAEAEAHARAALALTEGRGARREFESHFELFFVLLDASRAEEAASHLASACVHVTAENTVLVVASYAGSGLLAHARGDLTGAREWLARAHTLLTNAEFPPVGTIGRALRLLEARCGEDGGRSNPG